MSTTSAVNDVNRVNDVRKTRRRRRRTPRNAAAGGGGWCFDVIDVIDAVDIIDVPKTRRRRRRVPQNTPAKCPSAHGADVESTCVLAKLYGHERPTRTPYTIKVHPALSWVEIQSIAVDQYSRFEVFGVAIASRSSLDRHDLTVDPFSHCIGDPVGTVGHNVIDSLLQTPS